MTKKKAKRHRMAKIKNNLTTKKVGVVDGGVALTVHQRRAAVCWLSLAALTRYHKLQAS